MKVFISWSGDRSKYVARALYEWIPRVIQNVEPWLSAEMPKGVKWSPEIAKALDETKFGVFCVTPENQGQPVVVTLRLEHCPRLLQKELMSALI